MKKTFKWKTGHFKQSAQEVGEYLEQLREENGHLSPELVVEAARPKGNILHNLFEWNTKKAAEAYRLAQAGHLIRHLVVQYDDMPELQPVRAFVRIVEDEDARKDYKPVRDAMSDPLQRQQILARARDELAAWRRRYQQLEEFAGVLNAIETALRTG